MSQPLDVAGSAQLLFFGIACDALEHHQYIGWIVLTVMAMGAGCLHDRQIEKRVISRMKEQG